MSNIIVFDIETKNTFPDVSAHLHEMEPSVVGIYSYANDEYRVYDEHQLFELGEALRNAHLLVGFFSKRFDVPILNRYFNFNLASIPHFDIFEEAEKALGRRVSLGALAEANLGEGKSAHGLQAIEFYKNGEIQKLKDYCLQDVKITKGLFDLIRKQSHLWVPDRRTSKMTKIDITFTEPAAPPASLFS